MSILIAILTLSANGTAAPPRTRVPEPRPSHECRDERGRFRLHCFPKGTVKPMPGNVPDVAQEADSPKNRAKPPKSPQ
jgi:hypothetical protein